MHNEPICNTPEEGKGGRERERERGRGREREREREREGERECILTDILVIEELWKAPVRVLPTKLPDVKERLPVDVVNELGEVIVIEDTWTQELRNNCDRGNTVEPTRIRRGMTSQPVGGKRIKLMSLPPPHKNYK